jgi:hypothetical protein
VFSHGRTRLMTRPRPAAGQTQSGVPPGKRGLEIFHSGIDAAQSVLL